MNKVILILVSLWLLKNIIKFFKKIKISYNKSEIKKNKNFIDVQDGEFEEID